jgi:dihydrodipicolinate synthase/N-acetylneuraminate lyase
VLGQELGGKATAVYQSILKKAMELVGLPGGVVREPLENITDAEVQELKEVLTAIGIL